VRDEDGVRVEADVDGAIIVVVLEGRDPLGSDELLFQMMGDDLLLLASEGGARSYLIEGLACSSHYTRHHHPHK
jgi:hypothetical protein